MPTPEEKAKAARAARRGETAPAPAPAEAQDLTPEEKAKAARAKKRGEVAPAPAPVEEVPVAPAPAPAPKPAPAPRRPRPPAPAPAPIQVRDVNALLGAQKEQRRLDEEARKKAEAEATKKVELPPVEFPRVQSLEESKRATLARVMGDTSELDPAQVYADKLEAAAKEGEEAQRRLESGESWDAFRAAAFGTKTSGLGQHGALGGMAGGLLNYINNKFDTDEERVARTKEALLTARELSVARGVAGMPAIQWMDPKATYNLVADSFGSEKSTNQATGRAMLNLVRYQLQRTVKEDDTSEVRNKKAKEAMRWASQVLTGLKYFGDLPVNMDMLGQEPEKFDAKWEDLFDFGGGGTSRALEQITSAVSPQQQRTPSGEMVRGEGPVDWIFRLDDAALSTRLGTVDALMEGRFPELGELLEATAKGETAIPRVLDNPYIIEQLASDDPAEKAKGIATTLSALGIDVVMSGTLETLAAAVGMPTKARVGLELVRDVAKAAKAERTANPTRRLLDVAQQVVRDASPELRRLESGGGGLVRRLVEPVAEVSWPAWAKAEEGLAAERRALQEAQDAARIEKDVEALGDGDDAFDTAQDVKTKGLDEVYLNNVTRRIADKSDPAKMFMLRPNLRDYPIRKLQGTRRVAMEVDAIRGELDEVTSLLDPIRAEYDAKKAAFAAWSEGVKTRVGTEAFTQGDFAAEAKTYEDQLADLRRQMIPLAKRQRKAQVELVGAYDYENLYHEASVFERERLVEQMRSKEPLPSYFQEEAPRSFPARSTLSGPVPGGPEASRKAAELGKMKASDLPAKGKMVTPRRDRRVVAEEILKRAGITLDKGVKDPLSQLRRTLEADPVKVEEYIGDLEAKLIDLRKENPWLVDLTDTDDATIGRTETAIDAMLAPDATDFERQEALKVALALGVAKKEKWQEILPGIAAWQRQMRFGQAKDWSFALYGEYYASAGAILKGFKNEVLEPRQADAIWNRYVKRAQEAVGRYFDNAITADFAKFVGHTGAQDEKMTMEQVWAMMSHTDAPGRDKAASVNAWFRSRLIDFGASESGLAKSHILTNDLVWVHDGKLADVVGKDEALWVPGSTEILKGERQKSVYIHPRSFAVGDKRVRPGVTALTKENSTWYGKVPVSKKTGFMARVQKVNADGSVELSVVQFERQGSPRHVDTGKVVTTQGKHLEYMERGRVQVPVENTKGNIVTHARPMTKAELKTNVGAQGVKYSGGQLERFRDLNAPEQFTRENFEWNPEDLGALSWDDFKKMRDRLAKNPREGAVPMPRASFLPEKLDQEGNPTGEMRGNFEEFLHDIRLAAVEPEDVKKAADAVTDEHRAWVRNRLGPYGEPSDKNIEDQARRYAGLKYVVEKAGLKGQFHLGYQDDVLFETASGDDYSPALYVGGILNDAWEAPRSRRLNSTMFANALRFSDPDLKVHSHDHLVDTVRVSVQGDGTPTVYIPKSLVVENSRQYLLMVKIKDAVRTAVKKGETVDLPLEGLDVLGLEESAKYLSLAERSRTRTRLQGEAEWNRLQVSELDTRLELAESLGASDTFLESWSSVVRGEDLPADLRTRLLEEASALDAKVRLQPDQEPTLFSYVNPQPVLNKKGLRVGIRAPEKGEGVFRYDDPEGKLAALRADRPKRQPPRALRASAMPERVDVEKMPVRVQHATYRWDKPGMVRRFQRQVGDEYSPREYVKGRGLGLEPDDAATKDIIDQLYGSKAATSGSLYTNEGGRAGVLNVLELAWVEGRIDQEVHDACAFMVRELPPGVSDDVVLGFVHQMDGTGVHIPTPADDGYLMSLIALKNPSTKDAASTVLALAHEYGHAVHMRLPDDAAKAVRDAYTAAKKKGATKRKGFMAFFSKYSTKDVQENEWFAWQFSEYLTNAKLPDIADKAQQSRIVQLFSDLKKEIEAFIEKVFNFGPWKEADPTVKILVDDIFAGRVELERLVTTPGGGVQKVPSVANVPTPVQTFKAQEAVAEAAKPVTPKVDAPLLAAAEKFVKAPLGSVPYRKVRPEVSEHVASVYAALPHDPTNPKVKAAYAVLSKETKAQFEQLQAEGYTLEPWLKDGQPYATSVEMREDVQKNKHIWFFVGGEFPADNLMAQPSGINIAGKELTNNDVFRAVHDVFGHALLGNQFGPRGEELAYLLHKKFYSPEAHGALAMETRGQNSWVNFGPNKDIPAPQRPYAEQKNNLLPEYLHGDIHDPQAAVPVAPKVTAPSVLHLPQIASPGDYKLAVDFAVSNGAVSMSDLQQNFNFGYNKAADVLATMKKNGVLDDTGAVRSPAVSTPVAPKVAPEATAKAARAAEKGKGTNTTINPVGPVKPPLPRVLPKRERMNRVERVVGRQDEVLKQIADETERAAKIRRDQARVEAVWGDLRQEFEEFAPEAADYEKMTDIREDAAFTPPPPEGASWMDRTPVEVEVAAHLRSQFDVEGDPESAYPALTLMQRLAEGSAAKARREGDGAVTADHFLQPLLGVKGDAKDTMQLLVRIIDAFNLPSQDVLVAAKTLDLDFIPVADRKALKELQDSLPDPASFTNADPDGVAEVQKLLYSGPSAGEGAPENYGAWVPRTGRVPGKPKSADLYRSVKTRLRSAEIRNTTVKGKEYLRGLLQDLGLQRLARSGVVRDFDSASNTLNQTLQAVRQDVSAFVSPARDVMDASMRTAIKNVVRDFDAINNKVDEDLNAVLRQLDGLGDSVPEDALLQRVDELYPNTSAGWSEAWAGGTLHEEMLKEVAGAYVDQRKLQLSTEVLTELSRVLKEQMDKGVHLTEVRKALLARTRELVPAEQMWGTDGVPDPRMGDIILAKMATMATQQHECLKQLHGLGAVLGERQKRAVAEWATGTVSSSEGADLSVMGVVDPAEYRQVMGAIDPLEPGEALGAPFATLPAVVRQKKANIFQEAAVVAGKPGVPWAVRQHLMSQVLEGKAVVNPELVENRRIKGLTAYKKVLTTGLFIVGAGYHLANKVGDAISIADAAGLMGSIRTEMAVALREVLAIPGVANVRAGFQQLLGDKYPRVFENFLTMGSYSDDVKRLQRADGVLTTPDGRVYPMSGLLTIARRMGVNDTFASQEIVKTSNEYLRNRFAWNGGAMRFIRRQYDVTTDVAQMISESRRMGLFLELVRQGKEPSVAAQMTTDTLIDYRHNLHPLDRSLIIESVFMFWNFTKGNSRRFVRVMTNPDTWGMPSRVNRLLEGGTEATTAITDDRDEFGFLEEEMPPEMRAAYQKLKAVWRAKGLHRDSLAGRLWDTDPTRTPINVLGDAKNSNPPSAQFLAEAREVMGEGNFDLMMQEYYLPDPSKWGLSEYLQERATIYFADQDRTENAIWRNGKDVSPSNASWLAYTLPTNPDRDAALFLARIVALGAWAQSGLNGDVPGTVALQQSAELIRRWGSDGAARHPVTAPLAYLLLGPNAAGSRRGSEISQNVAESLPAALVEVDPIIVTLPDGKVEYRTRYYLTKEAGLLSGASTTATGLPLQAFIQQLVKGSNKGHTEREADLELARFMFGATFSHSDPAAVAPRMEAQVTERMKLVGMAAGDIEVPPSEVARVQSSRETAQAFLAGVDPKVRTRLLERALEDIRGLPVQVEPLGSNNRYQRLAGLGRVWLLESGTATTGQVDAMSDRQVLEKIGRP